ncbi:lytic murein transglycosylase [Kribbella sp. CWNU-51]
MRVPEVHKLIERHGRDRGRYRRGRSAAQNHWQVAGSVAAVVTLAASATAQLPDRSESGGYDAAGAAEASAMGRTVLPEDAPADPFVDDEVLDELVTPEQLVAVPVGPGRVAKPVQMVLSGAPVIRTLGESGIPDVAVRAYKKAEARLAVTDPGCGVPWTLLAAIGRVESNHGRFGGAQLRDDGSATRRIRGIPLDGRPNVALIRDSDGGALDGDAVYDRAVGPMQFIPSTWRAVNADGNGDGFADPNNMFDAAQGAAQYLCTGTSNLRDPARAAQAIRRYNNADSYIRLVLALARIYQTGRVIGLPSTGELLPDETDKPLALRPWPTTAPPGVGSWPTHVPPARRSWATGAPPGDTVLAKPAPTQQTEPAAPPRAVNRPQTTNPPPNQPNPLAPRPSKTAAPKPAPTTVGPLTTKTRPSEPALPQPPKPVPTQPRGSKPSGPKATEPRPSEPDPTQPKPSEPRPSEPKPSQPQASEHQPSGPKATEPQSSEHQPSEAEPTQPPGPTPSQPNATEHQPSEHEATQSPEPKPSQPRTSGSGSAGTGSPKSTPSAEPTLERKPTTAAVGWAPAMRQVVGRALARPGCPQARTPHAPTPQARTPEARTPQARTPQARTPQARTPQARTPQARTPQARTPQARTPQARTPKARTPQPDDQRPGTCAAGSGQPSPARDDKFRERCTPQLVCKAPSSPRPSAAPGR